MSNQWPNSIWYNPMENRNRIEFNEPSDLFRKWGKEYAPADRIAELEAKLAEQKPLPLPNHFLPDCMMPDGAEPCIAYRQLHTTARAMEAKLATAVRIGEEMRKMAAWGCRIDGDYFGKRLEALEEQEQ